MDDLNVGVPDVILGVMSTRKSKPSDLDESGRRKISDSYKLCVRSIGETHDAVAQILTRWKTQGYTYQDRWIEKGDLVNAIILAVAELPVAVQDDFVVSGLRSLERYLTAAPAGDVFKAFPEKPSGEALSGRDDRLIPATRIESEGPSSKPTRKRS